MTAPDAPFSLEVLRRGAQEWRLPLTDEQLVRFGQFARDLLEWNQRVNLTRIQEPADIQLRHFLDSLAVLLAERDFAQPAGSWPTEGARVIDVGSGGGFPGMPLAIVRPDLAMTLLDSVGKKAAFLRHAATVLGLSNISVVHARAEDAGRDLAHRERYDLCVTRALAPLNILVELCLPFCAVGGTLIAQKKGDLDAEIASAHRAIGVLGGRLRRRVRYSLPETTDERELVIIEKVHRMQAAYPRRAGLPERRPL